MKTRGDHVSDVDRGTGIVRWAALPTILMSLLNAPAAFASDPDDLPKWLAWFATVVGVAGFVVAIALLRRVSWGRPGVVAVGSLNAGAGVVALALGHGDGIVGIVLGLAAVTLVLAPARGVRRAARA